MIRCYFELSSHRREIGTVTGNNGWIISFVADRANQDIHQEDVEDYFIITCSTASRVLSLMEQRGLIERQAVAQDAHLRKIVLTPKALEIRGLTLEDAKKMEYTLIQGFTEEEIKTLLSYLERVKTNITNLQEEQQQSTIRTLLPSVREYKKKTILAPIYATLESILEIVIPTIMVFLIDNGIN